LSGGYKTKCPACSSSDGFHPHMNPDAWRVPDCGARWIIMLSHLYYDRDVSLIPDSEFDRLCGYVADNWDDLDPIRQWQLESPDAIRSSGFHIKLTQRAYHAAEALGTRAYPRQRLKPYTFTPHSDSPHPTHLCVFTTLKG